MWGDVIQLNLNEKNLSRANTVTSSNIRFGPQFLRRCYLEISTTSRKLRSKLEDIAAPPSLHSVFTLRAAGEPQELAMWRMDLDFEPFSFLTELLVLPRTFSLSHLDACRSFFPTRLT